jgi:hypothetical protein
LNTAANDDGEIEVFRDVAAAAAPATHGIRRYSRRYSRHGSVQTTTRESSRTMSASPGRRTEYTPSSRTRRVMSCVY